jgi:hypothetical protein
MYQCKSHRIQARKSSRVLKDAREFIAKWRKESSGSKPYVRVKCLGLNGKVFIDDFHYHIEAKDDRNMIARYRLLPCVKELLRKTRDKPIPTQNGNLLLDGLTPTGNRFRVIIRPGKSGGCLQSFYPD